GGARQGGGHAAGIHRGAGRSGQACPQLATSTRGALGMRAGKLIPSHRQPADLAPFASSSLLNITANYASSARLATGATSTVGRGRGINSAALKVAVLGGGAAGLAAGLTLKRAGAEVTVFEAGPVPGGKIVTAHREGFLFEDGPNSLAARSVQCATLSHELRL